LQLFAVLKLRPGHTITSLPDHPVMRRWWDHMAPLMDVEPDNRPREWALRRVFHLP
jgi:L-rhamnose mutarotase